MGSCFTDGDCPTGETCSVNHPPVFATGPESPGVGVCDATSSPATQGDTCYVFEPAGDNAGLSANCLPNGAPINVPITVATNTGSFSFSDPNGHFCPGQGGNADCTGMGNPNPCCTGAGTGSCNDFNGCFSSANSSGALFPDIPATCTGVSASGLASGQLITGIPGHLGILAGQNCVSAVGGALGPTINNALGIPSKVVASQKSLIEVN
jgi:hypothetical protein